MRPEDLTQFFEDAFSKIVPRDEAHRAKLEKFREKIRESNKQLGAEIDKLREQLSNQDAVSDKIRVDIQAKNDRDKAHKRAVEDEITRQTELISRIATRMAGRL